MGKHYILDGHEPIDVDLMTWAQWFEHADRQVAHTEFPGGRVSTVFLGLDHSFGSGPPLLFETMIFGGPEDGYCDRYTTWAEAEVGHAKAVSQALGSAPSTNAVDPQAGSDDKLTPRDKASS